MTTVQSGQQAPAFTLPGADGGSHSLAEALKKGPVVAAFFKITCPVCQFTFPFLERLHQAYGNQKVTFWGISQNDPGDAREFAGEYGVKFPVLVDHDSYRVSNQYGLTMVPTVLLIGTDGKVRVSSTGFEKAALETISAELAAALGRTPVEVFHRNEVVPDSKPG